MGAISIKDDEKKRDKDYFMSLLKDLCVGYDLHFPLMAALCEVESNWNTYATRYEPRYKYLRNPVVFARSLVITVETERCHQMTSWGIAQIMGANARALDYRDHLVRLTEPEIGLDLACKYFKIVCDRYPSLEKKLSTYNGGSPTDYLVKPKVKKYVDKVVSLIPNYERPPTTKVAS